jgi:VanZ family protein
VANAHGVLKRTKFDVDHAFQERKLLLVTMTFGPNGTTIYLNDRQAKVFPRFTISQSELSGEIVLGTSAEDYQPWPGEVRGMAIYSQELSAAQVSKHYAGWTGGQSAVPVDFDRATAYYRFEEGGGRNIHNAAASGPNLEIPKWFKIPHKPFLKSPAKEFSANWDYVNDVIRNIVGFMPLGFLLCAYLACTLSQRRAILYAILAGGFLSFSIEVLQFFVPPRNSGVTDIITNTLGAAFGALLAQPILVRMLFARTNSTSLAK